MVKKDKFVREGSIPSTLEGQIAFYELLAENLADARKKNEAYKKMLASESNNDKEISFKAQWWLYNMLGYQVNQKFALEEGVDCEELKHKIKLQFPDVQGYINNIESIKSTSEMMRRIIEEEITFDFLFEEYVDDRCFLKHYFVRIGDELRCACCGASTNDFYLTKKEVDFLTECANAQGMFIKDATKEDIPFIQVLVKKHELERLNRLRLDDETDEIEEDWIIEEEEIEQDMKREFIEAHMIDDRLISTRYLPEEKKQKLLVEINKEYGRALKSDSRFKALMLEECEVAKYEVLLLSGVSASILFSRATSKSSKIALAKAYYNISNRDFRVNSDYNIPEISTLNDIATLRCLTANPEINQMVLDLKVRR